jgi:hypothetical protein
MLHTALSRRAIDTFHIFCAGQQHICSELPTAGYQQTQLLSTSPQRQWGCECQPLQGFRTSRAMDRTSSRVCMGECSALHAVEVSSTNHALITSGQLLVLAMPTECGMHGCRTMSMLSFFDTVLLQQLHAGVTHYTMGYAQPAAACSTHKALHRLHYNSTCACQHKEAHAATRHCRHAL